MEYLLDADRTFPTGDPIDNRSRLFYLAEDNEIIASCQITRVSDNVEFCEKVQSIRTRKEILRSVIVSRLTIRELRRDRISIHKSLIRNVCQWIFLNTRFTRWYAKCLASFTRLYTPLGGRVLLQDISVREDGTCVTYKYIEGTVSDALAKVDGVAGG